MNIPLILWIGLNSTEPGYKR